MWYHAVVLLDNILIIKTCTVCITLKGRLNQSLFGSVPAASGGEGEDDDGVIK